MVEQWIKYLRQVGAQFENHTVTHFGQPVDEQQHILTGDTLMDLSYLGVIKVTGKDAQSFLQRQLTNDVKQVTEVKAQLNAWCSPKGRTIANFRLFKSEEIYYIFLPEENIVSVLKRMQMFVLRDDVKLEDISYSFARIGLAGANSQALLADCLGQTPDLTVNSTLTHNEIIVLRVTSDIPRYVIISKAARLQKVWECLSQKARPVGTQAWKLLNILAGFPQILLETKEEFTPQMINLQLLGGISFTKGCYVGQEVVTRTQHLGILKRRLYLVKAETDQLPEAGDTVYCPADTQGLGKIVNAQFHPEGGIVALAVLPIEHAETAPIHLHNAQGARLQILNLPYSVN